MIARSRIEIDQARLLTLHAAAAIDARGKKASRREISMIKIVAANMAVAVVDRAIQVHGALGLTDDSPLGRLWIHGRALRIADGADEVHMTVIAGRELARQAKRLESQRGRR
jgi:acyl-CoA dehydrogenase